MSPRYAFALFAGVALVAACTTDPVPGRSDQAATERQEDGVAPTAKEIAAALEPEGALGVSPEANEWGVNEWGHEVEVQTMPLGENGDPMTGTVAEKIVLEIASNYVGEPEFGTSLFRLMDYGGDIHHATRFGWDDAASRDYLLALTTEGDARRKLTELLTDPDLNAYYFWFHIYDVGAEFIGNDVFVIVPMRWDDKPIDAVILRTSYVYA